MLSLSFVMNVVAIVVLVFFKSYRRFVFRLVLSLLAASLLGVVVQILEIIPLDHSTYPTKVRSGSGWESACAAFGFMDQVAIWASNFVIIWIVVFLGWLMKRPDEEIHLFPTDVSVSEAVGICCCFFLPFTFNWIPFTNNYFGPSGHWCWIKLTKSDSCEFDGMGVAYMILFYYGPLMLIMLVASVVSVIAVVVWFKNIGKSNPLRGMIFIVVYPIVFNVVCCIVAANRFDEIRRINAELEPNFSLWVAHAVADPARTLLPAIFFLFQFFIPTTRAMVTNTRYESHTSSRPRAVSSSSNVPKPAAMYSAL